MPAEPGRLTVCALLGRARRGRGCVTPGDDRLETRVYAVKRYLFRLGHAAGSARYATSIEQLVVGLAPVMGWGPIPHARGERARFVRTHRRSVQRWLDDLQAAGLAAHGPERDANGMWWRTQIVLLRAPVAAAPELRVAGHRARGWRARERARRQARRHAPALGAIRARSSTPGAVSRTRLARSRARTAAEGRRRAVIEARIVEGAAVRAARGLLAHPFGAPPTSAGELVSPRRWRRAKTPRVAAPPATCSARLAQHDEAVVERTGARTAATATGQPAGSSRNGRECIEENGRVSPEDFDALVEQRMARREQQRLSRFAVVAGQVAPRAIAVAAWPAGWVCPLGRLREAWVVARYGLAMAAGSGAAAAGPVRPGLAGLVGRAIALYEAHAEQRPPGWPAGGAAALCVLAEQGRARRFAGDVARLLGLAKGMRAVALLDDQTRLRAAQARAEARRTPPPAGFGLAFRVGRARLETAEQRRRRVRDDVLLAGGDPTAWPNAALVLDHGPELRAGAPALVEPDRCEELDGIGARAARYRAEVARGLWRLPDPSPVPTDSPHAKEA